MVPMTHAQTTHARRMALIEEILAETTDDSSLEELLRPYAPRVHPVKKKKTNQLALSPSPSRRSKRLSPRRRRRPTKYSE